MPDDDNWNVQFSRGRTDTVAGLASVEAALTGCADASAGTVIGTRRRLCGIDNSSSQTRGNASGSERLEGLTRATPHLRG